MFHLLKRKKYYFNKYIKKNQIIHNLKKRKKLSLYLTDEYDIKFQKKWLKKILKDKYIITFEENNPDYLIYNMYGNNHLNQKYNKSIKIAYYTENKIPDLKEADYGFGQAHISYIDRYFKFPSLLWSFSKFRKLKEVRKKVLNSPIRSKFCAGIISNNFSTDGFRIDFINELNKYKQIDMGGKYKNNVGGRIKNKIKFLSQYKFSIAMENSNGDGYVSEKIVDAFISGTIPIYYGDYMIDEYFNPKTYILIKSQKDINKKIEYIKAIDKDNKLYKNILKENIIINEQIILNKIIKEEKEFFQNIFNQEKIKAFRISN